MNGLTSLLILMISIGCSSPATRLGDKHLTKKNAPSFLIEATPHGEHIDDVEYFVKKTAEQVTYELKYEQHDQEISVTFDEQGKRLETEEDIKFSSLAREVKEKINQHLHQRFTKYKIHEAELRTTAADIKLIDVEVSHAKGPTGLSELSFTPEGVFVSEEVEANHQIETLN